MAYFPDIVVDLYYLRELPEEINKVLSIRQAVSAAISRNKSRCIANEFMKATNTSSTPEEVIGFARRYLTITGL